MPLGIIHKWRHTRGGYPQKVTEGDKDRDQKSRLGDIISKVLMLCFQFADIFNLMKVERENNSDDTGQGEMWTLG